MKNISIVNGILSYGENTVLTNINVCFPVGLTALCGPSGMGKTSLLNVVYGKVEIEGSLLFSEDSLREHMSMIPVRAANIDSLSAEDNLLLVEKEKGKVKKVMERVSLWDKRKRVSSQLSLGEQQRLSMARAMLQPDVEVFLFDEPSANLDRKSSDKAFQILKELSNRAIVVVATHDVELAERYADNLYEVIDGEVKEKKWKNDIAETTTAEKPKGAYSPYFRFGMKKAFRKPWLSTFAYLLTIAGTMTGSYSFALGGTTEADITKGMLTSIQRPYLSIGNYSTVFESDPSASLKRFQGKVLPANVLSIVGNDRPFFGLSAEDLDIDIAPNPDASFHIEPLAFNEEGEIQKGSVTYPLYLSNRTLQLINGALGNPLSVGDIVSSNDDANPYHKEFFVFAGTFQGQDESARDFDQCHPAIFFREDFKKSSLIIGDNAGYASREFTRIGNEFNQFVMDMGRSDLIFAPNIYYNLSNDSAFSPTNLPFKANETDDPSLPKIQFYGTSPNDLSEGDILIPSKEFFRHFGQNSETLFPEMADFKKEFMQFYGKYLYDFKFDETGENGFITNVFPEYQIRTYRIAGYYEVLSPALQTEEGKYIQENGEWKRVEIPSNQLPVIMSDALKAKIDNWRYNLKGAFSNKIVIERSYAIAHPELLSATFDIENIYTLRKMLWEDTKTQQKIFPWIGAGLLAVSLLFIAFSLPYLEKDIAGAYRKSRRWSRKLPFWPTIASLSLWFAGLPALLGSILGYVAWALVGSRPSAARYVASLSLNPTVFLLTFLGILLASFLLGMLFYFLYDAKLKKEDQA